ncbi:hypothetical protein NEOLEDRAFT_1158419 [Neolentinus lepideus HHB14362 ss-1]|uniref:Uncharacterized protein n=1 Tax=Neolentinus lepideus HHB14362 ss-1 TaxID=1314782 RepID=A0A165PEI3_9AGAM|nr:hypothetical protein NEOLEDRAFT_1158419 [Neolentinus lepideus HHB14362 ss-1]
MANRSWYRAHFYDHPKLQEKAPEAYADGHRDKVKVWCRLCFDHRVLAEVARDQIWGLPQVKEEVRWLQARGTTLLVHLRDCQFQPGPVRDWARVEHERTNLSPRRKQIVNIDAELPTQYIQSLQWGLFPWVPARVPSFSQISILYPTEVQSYQDHAIAACHGHEATLECDGWSGVNHHHLLAFMIAVLCKVYTICVTDTTNQVKNADNLLEMLCQVIYIVAVTSDCSGESRSARKRLLQERPDLVAPDCYAHQINLVVGDYFKSSQWFFQYADMANDLIAWLRSQTFLLALLQQIQIENYHGRTLAIIHANHLKPLAIAANVTQAAHCWLDQVLLTFGLLVMQYQGMQDPDDKLVADVVISSLERRWGKADQDVFIAAVILNPFHKIKPFQKLTIFTNARLFMLMSRLWKCFYAVDVPLAFNKELMEYMNNAASIGAAAHLKGESPNPLDVWQGFSFSRSELSPLSKLAHQILSICANSASCECLFSTFELKMHLRDEHIQNDAVSQCLKRHFGGPRPSQEAATTDQAPSVPPNTPGVVPAAAEQSSGLSGAASDPELEHGEANTLANISTTLSQMVEEDEDQDDVSTPSQISQSLRELFDFSVQYWVDAHTLKPRRTLDDELELYQLLDMDADGEVDGEVGGEFALDDAAGAVLTM